jgi:hypothetical protein
LRHNPFFCKSLWHFCCGSARVKMVEAAEIEPSALVNTGLTTGGQNGTKSGHTCPNCGQRLELAYRTDANKRPNPVMDKPSPDELSPPNGPNGIEGLREVIEAWPKLSKQAKSAIAAPVS